MRHLVEAAVDSNLVDSTWEKQVHSALQLIPQDYFQELANENWLPGKSQVLNAFSQPLDKVRYVLLGESPYPRLESANGYAFWDANVGELWSATGLTKTVNRATSLRNIIKMLLVAEGLLSTEDLSQPAIAKIDKSGLVQTNAELFSNFIKQGFLLLNASLVLRKGRVNYDAKVWKPFIEKILKQLVAVNDNVRFLLFGRIAKEMEKLCMENKLSTLISQHPYNLSFVTNETVLNFFKPLNLLRKH